MVYLWRFYNLQKCLLGVLGLQRSDSPVLGGILGNVVFCLNIAATCGAYTIHNFMDHTELL